MRIRVTGERPTDTITVNGSQSRIITVAAGLVSSVNGQTGGVTLTAENIGADPAGAAAAAQTAAEATAAADATTKVEAHAAADDPHGDRAYADATFLPTAGGTLTGPISGPGSFSIDTDGHVTAESITLPAAATTVSKTLVITDPAGAVSYVVWRAPKVCTVTAVHGYRVGGTGATINAQANGSDLLATDLSLSTASTWLSGTGVQNAALAAGDSLSVAIRSITGTPTAVTIQVDLQGA